MVIAATRRSRRILVVWRNRISACRSRKLLKIRNPCAPSSCGHHRPTGRRGGGIPGVGVSWSSYRPRRFVGPEFHQVRGVGGNGGAEFFDAAQLGFRPSGIARPPDFLDGVDDFRLDVSDGAKVDYRVVGGCAGDGLSRSGNARQSGLDLVPDPVLKTLPSAEALGSAAQGGCYPREDINFGPSVFPSNSLEFVKIFSLAARLHADQVSAFRNQAFVFFTFFRRGFSRG